MQANDTVDDHGHDKDGYRTLIGQPMVKRLLALRSYTCLVVSKTAERVTIVD